MDFLKLVKRLATETGTELESKIDSVAIPPATAYGETTEHRTRLIQWIQQAWLEIQEDQEDWNWMVQTAQMSMVRGQVSYNIGEIVNIGCEEVIYDHLRPWVATLDYRYIWMVDGSTDRPNPQMCYYVPTEQFFGEVDRYNDQSFGPASRYSIDRKGDIHFDSTPQTDDYHIEFEFKALPQELLLDTDVPKLPLKFHMLIVYKAMQYYAAFDEAATQYNRASKLYRDWMNKLRMAELKEYTLPGTRS